VKLSLILPSLFPAAMRRAIDNLHATTRDVDYEILAVTPFEVIGANVRWIREEEPRGVVRAHALALEQMSGDVVVALADDLIASDNWAATALDNLVRRESGGRPFCLGLHQTNFVVGTVFGIYYPFFVFIRKTILEATGGHHDPGFVAHYADPDQGLRIWKAGGRCERTDLPLVARVPRPGREDVDPPAKSSAAFQRDMTTFVDRWGPVYGKGWETVSGRDFNLDIDVLFETVVGEEFSIFLNDPIFKRLHERYGRNAARMKLRGAGISPPPSGP
jgi:hypothetical protein